ncbi:polysaccharide deacetylase family protein [Bacillus mangrovi]|uniref:Polysaccharide deacetylase family protein n=1 Tax=Metabacillus mangrovi TaxID=1491830 RepID=A0A7X2S4S6_9BACI|nr:polysaccharide deacetylase family protein [Metabacillus mangrovi]MTH52791.1 polysaccharide deacetylase family protein [Metabacillus mangrovi]
MQGIRMKFAVTVLLMLITAGVMQNAYINGYVMDLKGNDLQPSAPDLQASAPIEKICEEVRKRAIQYSIPAKDAEIHTIWKATPGYNGREVDIQASCSRMKKIGMFKEEQLVFKAVKPGTHLSDLPPSPVYRGNPDKPMVSLLINVAWGNEYLPGMLETLEKNHVKATFFFEGRWVKENPKLAKMIAEAGHEIGNHSYTHPDMKTLSTESARVQMEQTNSVIKAVTGRTAAWFAPPSGSFSQNTVLIASGLGMRTALWSVDTIDWQNPAPERLIQRVMTKVHPGAMILMHPTKASAEALDQLIEQIKSQKLSLGTLTQLMDESRIGEPQ